MDIEPEVTATKIHPRNSDLCPLQRKWAGWGAVVVVVMVTVGDSGNRLANMNCGDVHETLVWLQQRK